VTAAGVSRRDFLRLSAVAGGGFSLGILVDGCAHVGGTQALGGAFHPNAWITITPQRVTFILDRAEMGQGVFTSHAQLVAEELEIAPQDLHVEFAPADRDAFGIQLTGGSTSVTSQFEVLRQAGATAREVLRAAAARRWGVPPSQVTARAGAMHHAVHGTVRYTDLATDAARESIPEDVPLKKPAQWNVVGKPVLRLDAPSKVNGSAVYGLDFTLPGLLHAVVVRSPVPRGHLKAWDAARAKALPGVVKVVEIPHGVAVVADSTWRARKAARAVEAQWDDGKLGAFSSEQLRKVHAERLQQLGKEVAQHGDVNAALAKHTRQVGGVYEVPFLAHAPMEPMNCTAHVQPKRCDIWVGTQAASVVQEVAARITGLSHDQVHVHSLMMGGGFGRRSNTDYVAEAVEVARHLDGPVKVTWSREEDLRHGQYRPAATARIWGAVNDAGMPVAWYHRMVTQSLLSTFMDIAGVFAPEWVPRPLLRLGEGKASRFLLRGHVADPLVVEGSRPRYEIPNLRVELSQHETGIPVTIWRSVGHSINAFTVESFVDELAHLGGKDPLELRRVLLKAHPRNRAVLELAAQKIGWGEPPAPGRFRGLAQHDCFDGYCAHAVEISVKDGALKIHRVVSAVDCGTVVNPDLVASQVEGSVMFGLSAALHQSIELKNGRVQQGNFHTYPLLSMADAPTVEVHIMPSTQPPAGVGELAVPSIAPALANALFAATGHRFRRLPLAEELASVLNSRTPGATP
jgi:isoquinoline 1-oxidoreductase beta subunit